MKSLDALLLEKLANWRPDNARQVLTRNAHTLHGAKADAEKDKVKIFFEVLEASSPSHLGAPEFDPHGPQQVHFTLRIARAKLVLRDPIRVQAAGQIAIVEYRDLVATPAQFRRASHRRRPPAHTRHAHLNPIRDRKGAVAGRVKPLHRIPLQPANLDRPLVVLQHHA